MRMNRTALLAVCKQHGLYQTPHLNDRLYCSFQGFTSIAGLEAYTGLRSLFLEGNALDSTEGLPHLPDLRCLFLQQNALTSLAPGLLQLPSLHTLNISSNQLDGLAGLEGCTLLHSLIATDNQLATAAALAPLAAHCTALESLDLQGNKLENGEEVLRVLAQLPHLKCLYLRGNPLVSTMRSYRKAIIAALPTLTYLDDRPVFEVERLCAEAWSQGGVEAEREARAAYRQRELERERRQVEALREIREAGWRKQREALGMKLGSGDPYLGGLPDDWQPAEELEEPPELRAARERLAAFTAAKQQEEPLPGAAHTSSKAENSCPNGSRTTTSFSSTTAAEPAAPPLHPAPLPAAVPEARVTACISTSATLPPPPAHSSAPSTQKPKKKGSVGHADLPLEQPDCSSCQPQAAVGQAPACCDTGSNSDDIVSLASSDEDCLDELD